LHDTEQLPTITAQFLSGGGRVGHYQPGQLLQIEGKSMIEDTTSGNADREWIDSRLVFVVQGQLCFQEVLVSSRRQFSRLSTLDLLKVYCRAAFAFIKLRRRTHLTDFGPCAILPRILSVGQSIALVGNPVEEEEEVIRLRTRHCNGVKASSKEDCWTIEVETNGNIALSRLTRHEQWMPTAFVTAAQGRTQSI
jgi:hypothetical protein